MTDTNDTAQSPHTNGTPPTGHDWGERTKQSVSHTAPGYWETDAYEIRQCFGFSKFTEETLADIKAHPHARMCYPDLVVHEKDPTVTTSSKGNDLLAVGERDSGKTTLAKFLAVRGMENHEDLIGETNAHQAIWRGRPDGSGWLSLKPWTTLWLPAHAEVDAHWMNEGDEADAAPRERVDDLEDVVRDVYYYDGIYDLLDRLGDHPQGTFNVVYPDPTFAGCAEAFGRSDRGGTGEMPFVPEYDADGDQTPTPLIHWWFGFLLARREYGPFQWMLILFDEMGDWAPDHAENDDHRLYDKVKAMKATWKALRKRYMSIYGFVQYETDVASKIRRRFQTRIDMPDGTSNPRSARKCLGFDDVGMQTDIMGDAPKGVGLCFVDGTKASFSKFSWPDFPPWPEDTDRWLRIRVRAPDREPRALRGDDEEETGPQLEYDDRVLDEWENQYQKQLRVLTADDGQGGGAIDVGGPTIEEELVSPFDELEFVDGLRDAGDVFEVRMTDGDEEIVVARIPKDAGSGDRADSPRGLADD